MLELMTHDKKNKNGEIRFVLLERIGQFKTDATASEALIRTAFKELY
jgi:3-dehydroquinate synthase